MKRTMSALFLVLWLACEALAAEKPKYEVLYSSVREAIARGEVLEVLAFLETEAPAAERNSD